MKIILLLILLLIGISSFAQQRSQLTTDYNVQVSASIERINVHSNCFFTVSFPSEQFISRANSPLFSQDIIIESSNLFLLDVLGSIFNCSRSYRLGQLEIIANIVNVLNLSIDEIESDPYARLFGGTGVDFSPGESRRLKIGIGYRF